MVKIAPSVLAANFGRLAEDIKLAEEGGADFLHMDIMDGRFVPNLTIGPIVVKSIRPVTRLPLEVHLMVEEPERLIPSFIDAGADIVTFHIECAYRPYAIINMIRVAGKGVGLALNPSTPLDTVEYVLNKVDMLLIMTVDPGFGGQTFIQDMLPKIRKARQLIDEKKLTVELAVDGGINEETAPQVTKEGADVLAVGSAVFGRKDPKKSIKVLKDCTSGFGH